MTEEVLPIRLDKSAVRFSVLALLILVCVGGASAAEGDILESFSHADFGEGVWYNGSSLYLNDKEDSSGNTDYDILKISSDYSSTSLFANVDSNQGDNRGLVNIGDYWYTSEYGGDILHKYDSSGNYVETINPPVPSNCGDITFMDWTHRNGNYFAVMDGWCLANYSVSNGQFTLENTINMSNSNVPDDGMAGILWDGKNWVAGTYREDYLYKYDENFNHLENISLDGDSFGWTGPLEATPEGNKNDWIYLSVLDREVQHRIEWTTHFNDAPQFNSSSVDPDPPLIGENVSYSAEVYDSDGSVDYTSLTLEYGGSTVVSDEQRTGTTPEWNDVFTPQDGNKWLNATLEVVDDKGAVTTTEINRFLGDSKPQVNISSPAGKVFDYDQSISVDTKNDGDSNPDEQLSCSLDLDGNQIDQRTVTEGDSYTVNARANLGNHSAVVTCTEQDDGKQDTGSTNFTVQDFEIQSVSSASQVFETEERSFSLSYRSGDMIQNQDAELSLNYDGETDVKSFSLQPSQDQTESIKRNIPLVNQNQTVKNFDLSVNYRYDNFTGQTETETVSGSDFSTNNTKEEGNFYNVEVVSTSDGNKYVLNGTRRKKIDLERGVNHTFNLTSSVQGHPFHISTSAIGGNFDGQITEGVSVTDPYNGNEHAAETGKLFYKPIETESRDLYYQCGVHQYMGADITLLEALTFSNSQTVNQAFSYDNSVFEDGLTQLEASTLDFEAKVNKQVTNNRADLSASSTLQQTGETKALSQNGLNFTGVFDTDLIKSTSTTTNLDTTVTVSFNGESRTFSNTDTLTLEKIQLAKSSSTGPKTLQFETRDEINNSLIDANVEAGITVNNPDQPEKTRFFGFDFNKDKTHELFLTPSDATITANVFEERSIAYENLDAGFPGRRHYLTDTTLDNETTNINLYLLEQTKGSTVRLELTNSDLQGLSNHLIRVERAFPDQNETRTVQLAKTGTEGFASSFLQLQERYIFTVFDENGDLVDQVGPETVTTTDKRIQVNDGIDPSLANVLNEVQFTDIQRGNQSLSVSYVSETQRLNNLFLKISSDGLFETKTLDVDSSEQPQGQLEVTDFNASDQRVFFELIGTFGETNLTLESGTFGQESNDFGNAGIFVSFLMFTALTLSGLFRPSAAIGLGVISIFVMSFTGFLAVGQQALISIAALAAVLIWRMSSQ